MPTRMRESYTQQDLAAFALAGLPIQRYLSMAVSAVFGPDDGDRYVDLHASPPRCGALGRSMTAAAALNDDAAPERVFLCVVCDAIAPDFSLIAKGLSFARESLTKRRDMGELLRDAQGDTADAYDALLTARQLLEFPTSTGHAPWHPNTIDQDGLLGDWWETEHRTHATALDKILQRHRTRDLIWSEARVLVTSRSAIADGPTAAMSALPARGGVRGRIAVAPIAGMIHRPGKATSPVFAVPASTLTLREWEDVWRRNWVSLGPADGYDASTLTALLRMFESAFADKRATEDAVAGVLAALD